ncbi:MAG: NADH-quinone oxidoreductase subunit NuoH [Dehalococcoidia bacterium]|nr:NADH-quinone oxidoreductase subunit NuoH [Dehalococcoidia bacterium]
MYEFIYDILKYVLDLFLTDLKYENYILTLLTGIIIAFAIINAVLGGVLALIWGERRLLGRFQQRTGPNRWGPQGILTSTADAVKVMFKEDIIPEEADKYIFNLAPLLLVVPVFIIFSVIPFGMGLYAVNINVSVLFILAVTSISGLSIICAAWASANRIAIFSALRSVAMLISYEIPVGLSLVGILLITESMSVMDIVNYQSLPFILIQPVAAVVFFLGSLAEINRTPFDLTEAESELAAGYQNDYSGMKWGLFYLGEFAAAIAAASVFSTLFLGGPNGPILPGIFWLTIKVVGVLFVIIWIRATWPRFRIDQVLNLAWKGLFELTLVNIVVTSVTVIIWPEGDSNRILYIALANWIFAFPFLIIIFRLLRTKNYVDYINIKSSYPIGSDKPKFEKVGS